MRDQQLPLHLKLPDHAVFESYFAGPNREALDYLSSGAHKMTWLWGEPSTGKTHLLQAAAAASARSVYLPLAELKQYGPSVLDGYDGFDVVCLDQLDAIIPAASSPLGESDREIRASFEADNDTRQGWEQALFSLFQLLVMERQNTLVVASRAAPRSLQFGLPDLASRLLSGPVFRLQSLDDEQRLRAIQLRASRRGLKLPDSTGHYLLKRLKRDMSSLCAFLDRLDTASLVHQSRLTIPLVRMTLDAVTDDAR